MSEDDETVRVPKTARWFTTKRELFLLFIIAMLCAQAAIVYRRNIRLRRQFDWALDGWQACVDKRSTP